MIARQGFAVAMAENPEIFLAVHVLTVGKEQFQKKCKDHFKEIRTGGATIIIASHSIAAFEVLYDRALWLAERKTFGIDDALDVVSAYQARAIAFS